MTLMLLEKISSLEAKVNVNRLKFHEMVSGLTKSPFLRRIVEVEAPPKYSVLGIMSIKSSFYYILSLILLD